MNKRFIIFVLSITVVFYLFNYYHTNKKQEEYEESQVKKEQITRDKKIVKDSDIKNRTAKSADLPINRIYENNQPVSWGIRADENSFITSSWSKEWPQSITIDEKQASLITTDDHFALYSYVPKPRIYSTYIPNIGTYDLQIISLDESGEVQIMLGEFNNGQLTFVNGPPKKNSLILYNFEGTYIPVGLYKNDQKTYIPLASSNFNSFTQYRIETAPTNTADKQEFFVLENNTMQIAFSNLGGSIAEINLPFKKNKDSESVVLPVNFDRIINKKHPENAKFPLNSYTIFDKKTGKKIVMQPSQGGYYPLLRRGIKAGSGYPPFKIPARLYAFSTISEDPEISESLYKVVKFNEKMIQFEAKFSSRKIIKTYQLPEESDDAPYCLFASIKVEGNTSGLWTSSGVPEVELISGSSAPMIKYNSVQNNKSVVEKVSLPKTSTTLTSFQPDWIANSNGYFTIIMDPLNEIGNGFQANSIPGTADPSRIVTIDSEYNLYPADKYPGYNIHLPLKRSSEPMKFRIYAGPLDQKILRKVDSTFTNSVTGYNPKYIDTQSFHGWFSFISEPFAKFLYFIMNLFHSITGSWGISIILLTVVLRIMMYPLNAWSIKSTAKMQEISPKLEKLKEKYKKDPKKGQAEMMAFYKENKINPLGGCLPLIIQMPFLFGMFDLLKSTFSLRGAPFIPGWINNLTAPDVLFSWSYPVPFIGTSFHLLPVLLGVVMFFQQKFANAQVKTKGPLTDQQKQQQKMGMIMTVGMTFLFYKFPSGLNIYWLSSMSLQILQQWIMNNKKLSKRQNEIEITPRKNKK